jgi:hypothetical protein
MSIFGFIKLGNVAIMTLCRHLVGKTVKVLTHQSFFHYFNNRSKERKILFFLDILFLRQPFLKLAMQRPVQ